MYVEKKNFKYRISQLWKEVEKKWYEKKMPKKILDSIFTCIYIYITMYILYGKNKFFWVKKIVIAFNNFFFQEP